MSSPPQPPEPSASPERLTSGPGLGPGAWTALTVMVFAALSVAWTWPAASAGGATMTGRHFDLPGTIWFIDASRRALPGLTDPLGAWPSGLSMRRADSFTLMALSWVTDGVGAVRLHNALQVLGVLLSALAAEAFARGVGARRPWSWLAGTGFAFGGLSATALLEGHVYHLIDPWLPLFAWATWRATQERARWWHGALAALGWAGALWTTAYLGLVATVLGLVFLGAGAWRRALRAEALIAGALGVAATGLPYLALFIGGAGEGAPAAGPAVEPSLAALVHATQHRSASLLNLAAPSGGLDLAEHSINAWLPAHVLAPLLVAPVVLAAHRGWRRLMLGAGLCLLLAMGPTLYTPGEIWTLLPMSALAWVPGGELLRFPVRFAWGFALCGGVLAARVMTELAPRVGRLAWPMLALALVDVFLWGGLPARQRSSLASTPSALRAGSGPLLDVYPEALGRRGELNAWLSGLSCFYQTDHGRPIFDDCLSPQAAQNPRLQVQRELLRVARDGGALGARLRAEGVGSVALHPDLFAPEDRLWIEGALAALDPLPTVSVDGGEHVRVYAVPDPVRPLGTLP